MSSRPFNSKHTRRSLASFVQEEAFDILGLRASRRWLQLEHGAVATSRGRLVGGV